MFKKKKTARERASETCFGHSMEAKAFHANAIHLGDIKNQ